jgi:hypothetical protein
MTSLRAAINKKCKDYIYDPKSGLGTWREQVEKCVSPDCGLYPVRHMPDQRQRLKTGQNGTTTEAITDSAIQEVDHE